MIIGAEIRALMETFAVLELYANAKVIHQYVLVEKVSSGIHSCNVYQNVIMYFYIMFSIIYIYSEIIE